MKIVINISMLPVLIFSILLASGCASTVLDVKNTEPMIGKSNQSPKLATSCIVDNVENKYGKFYPVLQDGETENNYAILVRSSSAGNAAFIEVEPMGTGSLITTRISNHYPLKGSLKNTFIGGC
jgi:hypothetical protein